MPTRLRRVRKKRGSRTHGWGQIGQHRPAGSRGGKGMAGSHKHRYTWIIRYEPDYFGKKGFVPLKRLSSKTINLKQLANLVEQISPFDRSSHSKATPVVNLADMGYGRLIGGGRVERPLIVVAHKWSKSSEEKIVKAGGKIIKPEEISQNKLD